MNKKKFIKNEKAVAGAIEFLLIIAFFAVILSYVQVKFVPDIMEEKEATHMETVSNQFSRLKALVGIQTEQNSSNPFYHVLTLGSRKVPYLFSIPSYGELIIKSEESTNHAILIQNSTDTINYNLSYIKYDAHNSEFVDQTYVLEGGGIIVKQSSQNSVMWVDPNLNASFDEETETIVIYFNIPLFLNNNEADNIAGFDHCYIKTVYSSNDSDQDWNTLNDIRYLNITTEYSNAWYDFMDTSFSKKVRGNVSLIMQPGMVSLSNKTGSVVEIDIYYKKSCIIASVE